VGDRAAVPHHAAAPARPGILVAVRPASALDPGRRAGVPRLRRAAVDRGSRPLMQPPAEHVHWMFATGFLLVGLFLLAEAVAGEDAWRKRAWRAYLWPSFTFLMGVLMWPVMVFFTNSTIHMVAHGAWAQVMMLAGAAELGLVRGKLHSPLWRF